MCQLYISIKKIKIMIDSLLSNGKKSPLTLKLKNSLVKSCGIIVAGGKKVSKKSQSRNFVINCEYGLL